MGKPTHAVVLYDDGAERVFTDLDAAAEENTHGLIELIYDYSLALLPGNEWTGDGMWRYRDLLPLGEGPVTYPLPVGGTPLISPPGLRETLGLAGLWLKDETRGPSASNKDRATALVLQQAMRTGSRHVACASTGNVAVSLAVGAAAAGKEAVTFVPADVADTKLQFMLHAGATVVKVRADYEAVFAMSREACRVFGWTQRNTGVNPSTVEAKKTVAFEVWEQLGREVPDVVVVPVGDGPTLVGVAKGFRELVKCGAADTRPRLIGVQAEGCQPVKRSWETGSQIETVTPETIADGIAVGRPVSGAMALRDVRQSEGSFVSVTDDQMLSAMRTLAAGAGVLAEPAGAAAFAGLLAARDNGLIEPDQRTVVLVTGSALKSPHTVRPDNHTIEVDADLEQLKEALARKGMNESKPPTVTQ